MFKHKNDIPAAIILLASLGIFCYVTYLSIIWGIVSALVLLILLHFIFQSMLPKGQRNYRLATDTPAGAQFCTKVLSNSGEQKNCIVCVTETEVSIRPQGITIPMAAITDILFQDNSTDEISLAGFCIDYIDSYEGPCQVTFLNSGWAPLKKTKKDVAIIQAAHNRWIAGSSCNPLPVIDVGAALKAEMDSVVQIVSHRA